MKVNGISGYKGIDEYVSAKISALEQTEKNFKDVYGLIVRERDNIFCETTNGYSIKKITYGEFADNTTKLSNKLASKFNNIKKSSIIGIYMSNSVEWLEFFWAILRAGYKPLLMNLRMSEELLTDIINTYSIAAIISEGKQFYKLTYIADDILNGEDCTDIGDSQWENEIILMSSGTTKQVKLCSYNGEAIFYQICDSAKIIKESKAMKSHYKGNLKLLTFLPFYHVFGLTAVFMWFAFFSRTFVLLRDYSASTLLNTVNRHDITHIFAVPLLWNTIYDAAIKKVKKANDGTYEKLMKGLAISEKLSVVPVISKLFNRIAFKEVRKNLFGDSIQFLISGGSTISTDVLKFFNSIGYHLADGYGMTEVGITSVELSNKWKFLTNGSVGRPFASVEYMISDKGELLVRGKTVAYKIMQAGQEIEKNHDGWYDTHDLAEKIGDRYYIKCREDDVIIGADGENINPDLVESKMNIEGASGFCLLMCNKVPSFIVSVPEYYGRDKITQIRERAFLELTKQNIGTLVKKIIVTTRPLMEENDIKVSRVVLAEKIIKGIITEANPTTDEDKDDDLKNDIRRIFSEVLGKEADEIAYVANLFYDLGGSSLDYFSIMMKIQSEFNVNFPTDGTANLSSINEISEYIRENR